MDSFDPEEENGPPISQKEIIWLGVIPTALYVIATVVMFIWAQVAP